MTKLTHITQIRPIAKIRRTRRLPRPGDVIAHIGQEVSPVQIVARSEAPKGYHVLRASDALNVSSEDLVQHLLVEPGDELRRGTPLMEKKGRFGRTKLFRSPVNGVLHDIQHGCLILQENRIFDEVRALMQGVVTSVLHREGAVIESNGTLIEGAWDSGREGFGELKISCDSPDEWLDAEQVDTAVRSRVLVAGRIDQAEVLKRLEANDGNGLIVGSMPARLCRFARQFSFPTIVTDGAGVRPMTAAIFDLLQKSEGKEVTLFSREAGLGGQRTAIVIPFPEADLVPEDDEEQSSLSVGALVRILHMGHESTVGEVVRLHDRPRRTPVQSRVQGADVRRTDGSVLFVPYSNIDMIRK